MYPLPEQPEPKTATLRPLPNVDAAGPMPLSAPLPDMLSAPLPAEPMTTGPLTTGPSPGPSPSRWPPGRWPRRSRRTCCRPWRGRGPVFPARRTRALPQPRARGPGCLTWKGSGPGSGPTWHGLRSRAEAASSWLASSRHYSRLINRQGVVPVSARMSPGDLAFLAEAREQILQFTELAGRLIDLHQPLDAGGITTDPSSPIRRCRSCMWRWPCPTFSILAEVVDRPPSA